MQHLLQQYSGESMVQVVYHNSVVFFLAYQQSLKTSIQFEVQAFKTS